MCVAFFLSKQSQRDLAFGIWTAIVRGVQLRRVMRQNGTRWEGLPPPDAERLEPLV